MKTVRRGLPMLCAVLLPPAVLAGSYSSFSGKLSVIATDWDGTEFYLALPGLQGRALPGQFSMAASAPGYNDQVAALMLAWSLGQTVTVFEDSTDSCVNNRANIVGVQITP